MDYLDSQNLVEHTLMASTHMSSEAGRGQSALPQFGEIPAHPNCLEECPTLKALPHDTEEFVRTIAGRNAPLIDEFARRFHDQGLYSVSVALKKVLLKRILSETGPGEQTKQFELLMASGAGLRRYTPTPIPNAAIGRSPGVLLHAANDAANRGYLKDAERLLRRAEEVRKELPVGKREASEAHYRMRVAQIRRTEAAGRSAINFARYDGYMTNTALLFTGHILVPTQPNRARHYFELILAKGSEPSWLYRAECMFGLAAIVLRTGGKVEEAYRKLVFAQYVNSLLNHQNSPHPDMHEKLTIADLTAPDLIVHDPAFAVLSRHHCTALRREAIIESGLQRELLADLMLIRKAPQFKIPEAAEISRKKTRVLVLGPDTENIQLLKEIKDYLLIEGYQGVLVKEEADSGQETIDEKMGRLAASCTFVITEQSVPAGQINELNLLVRSRHTIAILHQVGVQATWMQADLDVDHKGVKYFPYQRSALSGEVRRACRWAEKRVAEKEIEISRIYPWRR